MHLGRILCSLAMSLSCALTGGVAYAQTGPSLITDRQDYLPGETVILMGSGFTPGETVDVSIAIDDDANNVHIGDYDWMVELADDSGDFMTFWTVPFEAFGMTLRTTALGLTSSLVATTTFYDDGGTNTLNFHVNWGCTNPPLYSVDAFYFYISNSSTGSWAFQGFLWFDNDPSLSASVPANSQVYMLVNGSFGGLSSLITDAATGDFWTLDYNPTTAIMAGPDGGTTSVQINYTYHSANPPSNPQPTITVTHPDVDLGDIVGCLNGNSFEAVVAVSPATFGASATTCGGDDVPVVTNVDSVTLHGPGDACAMVTLTTPDPSVTPVQVRVHARIVYRFEGVLAPLSNTVSTKVKRGSNVPVKFRLFDCSNHEITTGSHIIDVDYNQGTVPQGDVDIDEPGNGDHDNSNFHYTGGLWQFNLKTNASYSPNSTYIISITTDDGVEHNAMISIKN